MAHNIVDWLEHTADKYPAHVAFEDETRRISWQELRIQARKVGVFLAKIGVVNRPVAFLMEKSVPAVIGMMGTVYARGFYSFCDLRQPDERLTRMMEELEPAVIFTEEETQERAETLFSQKYRIINLITLEQASEQPAEHATAGSRGTNSAEANALETDSTEANALGTISAETNSTGKDSAEANSKGTDSVKANSIKASPADSGEAILTALHRESLDTDPLYVNFTSGSTGVPKGVVVLQRSVLDFIPVFTRIFHIDADDRFANQAPFDFDVSVKDIYSALYTGAAVVLIPRRYFVNPTKLMDYLSERKVTTLVWAVSAMCFVSIMNGFQYRTPTTVRKVLFSGEVMPVRQLNIWRKYLPDAMYVNLYGPTEITCNCTYYILDPTVPLEKDAVIPAGKPFPNEKVFLLDEEDRLILPSADDSKIGEICVAGTCLAAGYYRNPTKTKEVFCQNPLNDRYPERIYRTGDLGRYDAQGNLLYVSRKDFQVKHLGHRIELGEIETAAMSLDGIDRACCLYDNRRKRLFLFYSGTMDKSELETALRQKLPDFMLPNKTIWQETLPLNKNGKIDRARLQEIAGIG